MICSKPITTSSSDLKEIILNGRLYVDKTEFAWKLVHDPMQNFFFYTIRYL